MHGTACEKLICKATKFQSQKLTAKCCSRIATLFPTLHILHVNGPSRLLLGCIHLSILLRHARILLPFVILGFLSACRAFFVPTISSIDILWHDHCGNLSTPKTTPSHQETAVVRSTTSNLFSKHSHGKLYEVVC